MAPITLSPEEHKAQLITEITKYRAINDRKTIPLEPLQALLTDVLAYLQRNEDEDFGGIDDSELMLAEAADSAFRISGIKRKESPGDLSVSSTKRAKVGDDSTIITLAESILQKTWGFPQFRLKQEQAIARLIGGGSAVVVFPTGGGKSLVYQIPALAFDEYDVRLGQTPGQGVTLVVSPLIALMKDQVDALKKRGVCAAAMDSSQSREVWLDTCDKLRNGVLKLLYVAPERLNNEGFIEMINATKVRLIAIDEAHCISEWGHAFRPDYLKVARFAKEVRAERILCLTATATPKVAEDVCSAFNIDQQGIFRTTTYRSNLRLLAKSFKTGKEKEPDLKHFLRQNPGPSIVYVQTHEQTETVCQSLKRDKFKAYSYHAGMSNDDRTAVQDNFMSSDNIIIVATIAFGMGIDKANIRNIVHYAIPKSLEGYSQEIGRAGRDGLDSTCLIYLCVEDIRIMEEWSRADVPSFRSVKGLKNALDLLNAQLELRFELIRAITPKYSKYQYIKTPSFAALTIDGSRVTEALKKHSSTAKKWTYIDVDTAARNGGFDRAEGVRKMQEWNDRGAIELQPSGVVNRFRILKDFPQGEGAKDDIITALYNQIEAREKSDMDRVRGVIDLITTSGCLSRELARHFGDEDSIPESGCSNCSFCLTKTPIEFIDGDRGRRTDPIDDSKIQAILSATAVRDDARFLARVAFGISSPRVTSERLNVHELKFTIMSSFEPSPRASKRRKITTAAANDDNSGLPFHSRLLKTVKQAVYGKPVSMKRDDVFAPQREEVTLRRKCSQKRKKPETLLYNGLETGDEGDEVREEDEVDELEGYGGSARKITKSGSRRKANGRQSGSGAGDVEEPETSGTPHRMKGKRKRKRLKDHMEFDDGEEGPNGNVGSRDIGSDSGDGPVEKANGVTNTDVPGKDEKPTGMSGKNQRKKHKGWVYLDEQDELAQPSLESDGAEVQVNGESLIEKPLTQGRSRERVGRTPKKNTVEEEENPEDEDVPAPASRRKIDRLKKQLEIDMEIDMVVPIQLDGERSSLKDDTTRQDFTDELGQNVEEFQVKQDHVLHTPSKSKKGRQKVTDIFEFQASPSPEPSATTTSRTILRPEPRVSTGEHAEVLQEFLGDHPEALNILKSRILSGLTGKRILPLVNLEEEHKKVQQLVEQTVLAGEGNSMLIIGSRGSGKTALVETVISELSSQHQDHFHVVRLNGFIHTDDKLALREIWRQLGKEMDVENDDLGGRSNYADTLTSLLALLAHPIGEEEGDEAATATSVVFILDEFDLFAFHPRQTLLYNLFDVAQSRNAPIAVLGLTTKVNVVDSLEKRVKSRFGQRYVHLSLPETFTAFQEICLLALSYHPTPHDLLQANSLNLQTLATAWNSYLTTLFQTPPFHHFLQTLYTTTKSIPAFLSS
ncbi:origin recognition complex subunit 4, partial [Lecanoromycetidae sp. Uapishka_2]